MKILVAGGGGYIGTSLVPALLEHGYDVTVIDLFWFGNHLPKQTNAIKMDLLKCGLNDLKGFDQVVFLAGLSNDPMAEFNPVKNFVYNAALPAFLAFEAKKAKVKRFIYGSTCSVYGYTIDQFYNEEAPVTCNYPYGISKLQGENGVMQLIDDDFSVISLRQGTICGYSPRMRLDLIVNTMFKTAIAEQKLVVNNPSIWRPIYDMRDAVTGFLRAIQANQALSGVFNMTSGNYTVGQVGDMVKSEVEELTGKHVSIEIKNMPDIRNYKVSIEKAKTLLSFQPEYSIKDTIIGLFDHKTLFNDFENPNYYNINVFKKLNNL